MNGNNLRVLPAAINSFVNIERLSLDQNHIVSVPNEINNCKKLRQLSLAKNEILMLPTMNIKLTEFIIDDNPCRNNNNNNNNNVQQQSNGSKSTKVIVTISSTTTTSTTTTSSASNVDALWNFLENQLVNGVTLTLTKLKRADLLLPRKLDGHIPLTFAISRNNLDLVNGKTKQKTC